jgi:AraC family transcriptional regulator, melibiose operon regulatory protein
VISHHADSFGFTTIAKGQKLFWLSKIGPQVNTHRRSITPLPAHERRFYSAQHAFGRFGVRIFDPVLMAQPHWHGHVEINLASNFEMDYAVDGQTLTVPANRAVVFWAGIPHQLTAIRVQDGGQAVRLCNIYLPLDAFLMMRHIAPLQVALLGGGMVVLPEGQCGQAQMQQWYADYRSGDFERSEVIKMELNALFRRAGLNQTEYLRAPANQASGDRVLSSQHVGHVIAMVQHVLNNLQTPLRNAEVTVVTGLHENYALSLFSRIMQMPLKQFQLRMRLMRARALLVESTMAISAVAEGSGFSSVSQFYAQFTRAYGMPPAAVRKDYLRMEFRG